MKPIQPDSVRVNTGSVESGLSHPKLELPRFPKEDMLRRYIGEYQRHETIAYGTGTISPGVAPKERMRSMKEKLVELLARVDL